MFQLPAEVRDAAHQVLSRLMLPLPEESFSVMGSRQDYWVLRAGQPGTQVIIKLAGAAADEPSFERAAAIHRLVRTSTNTPMADFLLADDSFRSVPFRFSVQKAVE